MNPILLRDPETARQYLLQGLWFQRAVHPGTATLQRALRWSLIVADAGHPLPPTGFVADLGHIALGREREERAAKEVLALPGVPPGLIRTYEDHVLGKIYADWSFERASDALKRIRAERKLGTDPLDEKEVPRRTEERRALGLAYVIKQFRERAEINGVELSPAVIRGLLDSREKPEDLLRQGWESLHQHGPLPYLIELYEQLIAAARRLPEVLALEDVLALEQQTALLSMGEYVAHRQILQTAARLEESLPRSKVRPLSGRREVPTRVLDEDTYPVGGFTSISTRGSVESLLQSQLAFMEKDPRERPDLFDMKYLRDELYFYSRDENQFLRRRRSFLFVLQPDLRTARYKDPELPCQRIVLVLATLVAAVRRLADWLGHDALRFEFLFVQTEKDRPLEEEAKLLTLIFRELIDNKTASVEHLSFDAVAKRVKEHGRKSLCQCLLIGVSDSEIHAEEAAITGMRIDGPQPVLHIDGDDLVIQEGDDPFEKWTTTLLYLLQMWI
jgi:vWA domain found in the FtsH ternary systems/N-terminal helical region fused to the FtsH ternary system vWA domain